MVDNVALVELLKQKALAPVRPSWRQFIEQAWNCLDSSYVEKLAANTKWLPLDRAKLFAPFTQIDRNKTHWLLIGESPYPRQKSAVGVAFFDGDIGKLWDGKNWFSKPVAKATSLLNLLKAILLADGRLQIGATNKKDVLRACLTGYITDNNDLFSNFFAMGVLPFNSTPVLYPTDDRRFKHTSYHANAWCPFNDRLLQCLVADGGHIPTILGFGPFSDPIVREARRLNIKCITAEHPRMQRFISNVCVQRWLRELDGSPLQHSSSSRTVRGC
jgi:uracil-DNA glycosylase